MIKLALYQSIFCGPTHLTSCYTETALLASYISFHNKERSAVVEIFFFYTAAAQQREKEEICGVWNCLSKVVLLI